MFAVDWWLEILFGSTILLSGVTEPLVLLVVALSLNGLVMFVYSVRLIKLNKGVLPKEIGAEGRPVGLRFLVVVSRLRVWRRLWVR